MRTVSMRLSDLLRMTLNLGFRGENERTQFVIDCKKMFEEYPTAIPSLAVVPPVGNAYPAVVTRQDDSVVWVVKDSDVANDGDGRIQLTFTVGEVVAKTYEGKTRIGKSIMPTGTAPSPIDDWITEANTVLGEIPSTIDEALEEAKASGEFDGEDGFSPVVTVSEISGGHSVSVTDAHGTQAFNVMDGDSSALIDDTDPDATEKTFSAKKISELDYELNSAISAKYEKPQTGIPASDLASGVIPTVHNVPSGGSSGQVLGKASNTDYDVEWKTVSGGGTVDSSLSTSSENPVQNKVITAEINNIESATVTINNVHEETDLSTSLEYETGKYTTPAGYVGASSSYKMSEKFAVNEGEVYSTTSKWNNWRYVTAYNGDTAVEAKGATNVKTYTVPSDITHLVITFYSDHDLTSGAVIKTVDYVEWKNSLEDDLDAEEETRASADEAITADVNIIKNATVKAETISKEVDITADLTWVTGQYIDKTGYNGASASYNRCTKFAVNVGDVYKITWSNSNWRYVTAYSGDTAVEAKGAANVNTYTVPQGVTHLVFTLYADNLMTYKSVIRVDSVPSYENNATTRETSFVKRKARVTFIDDDGYAEFYTYFVPIMEEYNVPMCSAYMGDVCPTFVNPAYMTEAQCRTVEQLGGEIVVHGGTSLTEFNTVAQAEENVLASKKALEAHGFKSDVYVYPGSANNIEIREMMSKHFKCAFKTGYPQKGDTRVNDKCVPHYFIHRVSAGGYYDDKTATYGNYDTYTLDYFKAVIDDAVTRGGWLVFMTHAWMMPIGCSYRLQHDSGNGIPADLDEFELIEDIIEYIQTLKANNTDIEIVTASEGFEMFKNEVQSGDYLGYWNETYTDPNVANYWHSKPGFAVNKLGDIDFADGNRISHT